MHVKGGKTMRVRITENIITVETDIPKSVVENGIADLVAYDEKQNPLYAVKLGLDGTGNLSQYGLIANTIIDDKLAVVITEAFGIDREAIKKKYYKAVLAANKFCPIIAAAAASEEELVNSIFADAE